MRKYFLLRKNFIFSLKNISQAVLADKKKFRIFPLKTRKIFLNW